MDLCSSFLTGCTDLHTSHPPNQRLLVAMAGIPGSGKTTLARKLVERLNARDQDQEAGDDHMTIVTASAAATSNEANQKYHNRNHTDSLGSDPLLPKKKEAIATAIPMDGFHLSRAQLAAMPNPEFAIFRRGAPFTFDATAYLALVRRLREPVDPSHTPLLPKASVVTASQLGTPAVVQNGNGAHHDHGVVNGHVDGHDHVNSHGHVKGHVNGHVSGHDLRNYIYAPSFDHAIKDPVADDILIPPSCKIVVFEGNYLALDDESSAGYPSSEIIPLTGEWSLAASLMDLLVFVEVDEAVAVERLANRHVESGICRNEKEARARVHGTDILNAREMLARRVVGRKGQEVLVVRSEEEEGGWGSGTGRRKKDRKGFSDDVKEIHV